MSEQSQGPGWWLASDGRWYPPDQAPAVPPPETWAPPPSGPPPGGRSKTGLLIGLGIAAVVLVVVLAALVVGTGDDGDDPAAPGSERTTTTDGPGEADGGDGATGTEPEAAALPTGFELLEGDGVTIGAPDTWLEVPPEDFNLSPEQLGDTFPDLPEQIVEQFSSLFAQGAVLAAFEPTSAEFASNVNVISAPGEVPLGVVDAQVADQLATLGAEDVATARRSLPAGEALRVEYSLAVPLPDGSTQRALGVQYYVPVDGRTYIVTVSAGDDEDEDLGDVMAETFRVG